MASKSGLYKLGEEKSRHYIPDQQGSVVDVVSDYPWTINPRSSRSEVPRATLVEYQQNTGQIVASFLHFTRQFITPFVNAAGDDIGAVALNGLGELVNIAVNGDEDPSNIYRFKYLAEPTGFRYVLPYFGDLKVTRSNSFEYDDNITSPFKGLMDIGKQRLGFGATGGIFGKTAKKKGRFPPFLDVLEIAPLLSEVAKGIGGVASSLVPGKVGLETTKSWRGTTEGTYDITFDLFNTHGDADTVMRNRDLIHLLEFQNTPYRRNLAVVDPPVIYSLHIPDVVHLPACNMSALNVNELGVRRQMSIDSRTLIIPEAYRITMTFNNLLEPTRNILLGLDSGEVVQAVGSLGEALKYAENNIVENVGATWFPRRREETTFMTAFEDLINDTTD